MTPLKWMNAVMAVVLFVCFVTNGEWTTLVLTLCSAWLALPDYPAATLPEPPAWRYPGMREVEPGVWVRGKDAVVEANPW